MTEKQQAILETKQKHPEWGGDRISKHLNICQSYTHRVLKKLDLETPINDFSEREPNFTHNKTQGEAESRSYEVKTLDDLIKICKIDLDVWDIERHTVSKQTVHRKDRKVDWSVDAGIASGTVNDSGNILTKDIFNVKAWLTKKPNVYLNELAETWTPPKIAPLNKIKGNKNDVYSDKVFVIGLSDIHFGAKSQSKYMFNKPDWDTHKTIEAIDNYAKSIAKEVSERNIKFKKAVIISLGDLIHSMLGKTARGTELTFDYIKEEQYDYAMTSLCQFFSRMIEIFGDVSVKSTHGNHAYELDMALMRGLDAYFRNDSRIEFEHFSARPSVFKIQDVLIMLDHGQDSKERQHVPPHGLKREKYIQDLFLNVNPELLKDNKTRLFLQGDKHHFEHIEYNQFEFIMFGTIIGGDEHASINNWHNRARQNCLVIDSSGLHSVISCYFD